MTTTTIFVLILANLVFGFVLERVLDFLNLRRLRSELPETLKTYYDAEKYARSQAYQRAKSRIGLIGSTLSFAVTLVVICTGALGLLDNFIRNYTSQPFLLSMAFFGILALLSDILGMPFSLYNTFVIEEKYGFNQMTLKTWAMDKLKGLLVGLPLGAGLLFVFTWSLQYWEQDFWIWFWLIISVLTLLFQFLYTSLFLPIFNQLKPLEAGELRKEIEHYAQTVDFPLDNILVMDGSRRSKKANAFFAGFGSRKRIVLYDTLIAQMNHAEILAVLAHEVGHYKRKHIILGTTLGILNIGVMLFLASRFIFAPNASLALGATIPSQHLALTAFIMLITPVSQLISLGMNLLSRKNEYEADAFAKSTYDGKSLELALIKLHVENLSNLEPHPLSVFLHYSHPTLLQRIAALAG